MSAVDLNYPAPPVHVQSPPRAPQRFGLFSVATVIESPEPRFQVGIEFEPLPCGPAGGVAGECVDPDLLVGDYLDQIERSWTLGGATPFAVYGWHKCSAFPSNDAEAEARARGHLALGEEREVERAVAVGDLANEPFMAAGVDLTPAAGFTSAADGIGILEGFLGAEYGGVGVIHVPRRAGVRLTSVRREGQRLETNLGNYVAAGGGYDLAQAVALEGEVARFYVTSRPTIRRSEVFVTPEAGRFDHRQNNVVVAAQRIYVVSWECVTAFVDVNLGPEPA